MIRVFFLINLNLIYYFLFNLIFTLRAFLTHHGIHDTYLKLISVFKYIASLKQMFK